MGTMFSTTRSYDNNLGVGAGCGKCLAQGDNEAERESFEGKMDGLRFAELMHALQKVARLQREATSAQIDARQKRREAAFKRQEVWLCDARFMGEIQRLSAQGKLEGLEELQKLAARSQSARDDLGPLEQEGTDAEQCWEGQIYMLRQAEEQLYTDFNHEFSLASAYPPLTSSVDSSRYKSSSGQTGVGEDDVPADRGQMIIPYRTAVSAISTSSFVLRPQLEDCPDPGVGLRVMETTMPGLEGIGGERQDDQSSVSSDSRFEDINDTMYDMPDTDVPGPSQPLPNRNYPSFELYPHLLIGFTTKRDRINKWLESTILESHLEATSLYGIVKTQLAGENKLVPSNWSQLVIAYWELDGAANLRFLQDNFDSDMNPFKGQIEQQDKIIAETPDGERSTQRERIF